MVTIKFQANLTHTSNHTRQSWELGVATPDFGVRVVKYYHTLCYTEGMYESGETYKISHFFHFWAQRLKKVVRTFRLKNSKDFAKLGKLLTFFKSDIFSPRSMTPRSQNGLTLYASNLNNPATKTDPILIKQYAKR